MRAHRLRHICDRCILGGVDPAAGECKPVNFCVFHTTVLVRHLEHSPTCTENRGCYTIPHNAQEWGAPLPDLHR
jgi:hypothetical protein